MESATTAITKSALTSREQAELSRLESKIEAHQKSYDEVGAALDAIAAKQLHRGAYKSFEDYVFQVWSWSRSTAYEYIQAAEIAADVRGLGHGIPPSKDAAMALATLDRETRRKVWDIANKRPHRGRLSGPHLDKIVEEVTGRPAGADPGEISIEAAKTLLAEGLASLPEPTRARVMADMVEDVEEEDKIEASEQETSQRDKAISMIRKALAILLKHEKDKQIVKAVEKLLELLASP